MTQRVGISRRSHGHVALTELGFGAAQLGNLAVAISDEQSRQTVDAAWDGGIRFFDTAPHYGLGLSERRLGAALRGHRRDEYVVSTKAGRLLEVNPGGESAMDDEGFVVPASHRRRFDFGRDGILRSVEGSLERLGLDRLDIVFLHDPDDHWEEASTSGVETLIALRDEGVVDAIGVGMNQAVMLTEFIRRCDVDLVMCAGRYTLLDRAAEEELLPVAAERGVGVIAAAVFNSGLLSGSRVPDDATFDYAPAPQPIIDRARRLARICERYGVTLPEVALRFPLRDPNVVSVVVGMSEPAQVRRNVADMAAKIPDPLWEDLAQGA